MTWTTPRVWAVGETVTAANFNTYVSNNLTEITSPPYAYLMSNTATTMTTASTWYAQTWDTEIANVGSMHSTGTNPTRITASQAGTYHIDATIAIAQQAAVAYFQMTIFVNGVQSSQSPAALYVPTTPSANYGLTLARYVPLAASDYVEIKVRTGSTGYLTVSASGGNRPICQMRWVGP
jgi:hypothetical protein